METKVKVKAGVNTFLLDGEPDGVVSNHATELIWFPPPLAPERSSERDVTLPLSLHCELLLIVSCFVTAQQSRRTNTFYFNFKVI